VDAAAGAADFENIGGALPPLGADASDPMANPPENASTLSERLRLRTGCRSLLGAAVSVIEAVASLSRTIVMLTFPDSLNPPAVTFSL
jgi:hypothetical protein